MDVDSWLQLWCVKSTHVQKICGLGAKAHLGKFEVSSWWIRWKPDNACCTEYPFHRFTPAKIKQDKLDHMGESKSIYKFEGLQVSKAFSKLLVLSMIPNASKRAKREELQKAHRFSGLQPLGWTSKISIWEWNIAPSYLTGDTSCFSIEFCVH